MEEYESAVDGIVLTRFAPPNKELSSLAQCKHSLSRHACLREASAKTGRKN